MDRPIARRDFLNGAALALGAALAGPAFAATAAPQDEPGYYPPELTGMRGSHPGSFEAGHRLRDGAPPLGQGEGAIERHDLIIVGGGISGLAAAAFTARPSRRGACSSSTITTISADTPSATNSRFKAEPTLSTAAHGRSTVQDVIASSPPGSCDSSASRA
jgi:hypothetical protein